MRVSRLLLPLFLAIGSCSYACAELRDEALATAQQATAFLTDHVSSHGGYVWSYSADLQQREGEGVVGPETIWVQPPGTPAVGIAFVNLYQATGDQQFRDAAVAVAEALRQGQMRSGGWQANIDFAPDSRKRWAYRVHTHDRRAKDQSTLDDNKTQSALQFLILLDEALSFKDKNIHEMTLFGLGGLLTQGQFSGGGFPQTWTSTRPEGTDTPLRQASYPDNWPRVYQGHQEYWYRYTLNDHLASDVMEVLLLAERVYHDSRYRDAALRLGDSLLAAQMPLPQPAWAQQYSGQMQPIWARKFEPPAITSSESFSVLQTLMQLYRHTGDAKYLEPIPRALEYLKTCELPDGRVARFYELKTNRPLYFTLEYELTYDDSQMPTHYGFQLASKVSELQKHYDRLIAENVKSSKRAVNKGKPKLPSNTEIRSVIDSLDARGAWLSDTPLRYNKQPEPSIQMSEVVKNLNTLARYLAN